MSKITVVRSTTTKADKGYDIVELAYKTEEGKTKSMKIFGFKDQKENSVVASKASQGDVLDAEFEQNDKGYWQFRTLRSTGQKTDVGTSEVAKSGSTGVSKGGWETAEERAARQVMIVRQSSLATAERFINSKEPKGVTVSVDEVIEIAKQLEAYVLSKAVVEVQ